MKLRNIRKRILPQSNVAQLGWDNVDPVRRRVMRANTMRDTSPEVEMKRLLRRHKLSFKCDARGVGIRYRADFIFSRPRIAVFVDGCFWHGCPVHWSKSKTRTAYWLEKRRANRLRDRQATKAYVDAGWVVYRIWEHDRVHFPFLVSDLVARVRS